MYMQTELLKIIEGGLEKNKEKVQSYTQLLIEKLKDEGENQFAERITNLLSKKSVHPVYLDEFLSKPVDQDSRLDMVDVSIPDQKQTEIILPEITGMKIDNYVTSIKHRSKFMEFGVNLPDSLLLYGPPGCGKTSIAHYISKQTGLPLITAKLDGLISSLLGSTAKNIRKIFEYAKERPCILFLDEFDAIAKARNDGHEVGELKRVVNSLLQNIDDFNSENNILIAATNHEQLLDPAVWRRFTNTIEVPKPTNHEIEGLIRLFTRTTTCNFCDENKKMNTLANILFGYSPSDIKAICYNSIRRSILAEKQEINYASFLYQIYLYKDGPNKNSSVIHFLNENGVSQADIAEELEISMRQVRKALSTQEEGRDEQ
jgi:SpoVK/Ycf46/Vps4 family AAA+-type ATPase